MAGAAGFEPAVPGLGGQCIIQAMLHARFSEGDHLKKCIVIHDIFNTFKPIA
jgi:hypothetical protein